MSKSEYAMIEAGDVGSWSAETAEADVVIIGLGCAGICAAISAREAGADVLVFERASGGGGVTGLAAGHLYLGGGTRVQKAVGVEDARPVGRLRRAQALRAVHLEPDEAMGGKVLLQRRHGEWASRPSTSSTL